MTNPPTYTSFEHQFIAGEWRTGRSTQSVVKDTNPYNGETIVEIPGASVADINDAYAAAKQAQIAWAATAPRARAAVMRRAAEIILARRDEIIDATIREVGGVRKFAEIVWYFAWSITDASADYPSQSHGLILPTDVPGQESRVYRKPLGIVTVISPWNSPINLTQRSIAPALALGNSVVLKPASDTPITGGLMHAKIFEEAGLPKGVLNVVVGGSGEIGDAVTTHPDSHMVSFTGSTNVGRSLCGTGVAPTTSTVTSGIVYNDVNSNGFQDPGESGLPGISVRLVTPAGETATITSDGSDGRAIGSYSFDQVPSNSYIQVVLPGGTWLAQNPPRGVDTNSNGTDGLQVGVSFTEGAVLDTIPFDAATDNPFSVSIKSGDLQQKGRENLIIRTSSSLYVQYFGVDGSTSFSRYDVSSPAGYFKPELELADVNGDGRLDIVTSGQSGVDVYLNIGLGQFKSYFGLLADQLNSSPNGAYSVKEAFTGDVDSGVTTAKTYTHALNFNGSAATVNGVTFQAAGTTGSNFKLEFLDSATATPGTVGSIQGFPNALSGGMNNLASSFCYSYGGSNGGERLTLTGLTAGVTYTTTFYAVGYGSVGERKEIVFDSLGGSVTLDENASGNGNGFTFSRTFTATSDSITFTFVPQTPPNSFHHYALTNEVAAVGYTPVAPFAGDDDSTIDAGHHYTHALDFAGDQSITIHGVPTGDIYG